MFDKYLFRCSFLPTLMSNSRSKTELLSETAKAGLRDIYIQEVYKREKFVFTPAIIKGISCESNSLDLVKEVTGKTYFKNKEKLSNSIIHGTPDVIGSDFILDIKTSWDLWTFASVDEEKAKKDYWHQLAGYCLLTGKRKFEIVYALVSTPEELIEKELYKMNLQSEEQREIAKKNFLYDDIPANKRLKRYTFDVTDDDFKVVEERVKLAREYMGTLEI